MWALWALWDAPMCGSEGFRCSKKAKTQTWTSLHVCMPPPDPAPPSPPSMMSTVEGSTAPVYERMRFDEGNIQLDFYFTFKCQLLHRTTTGNLMAFETHTKGNQS